MTNIDNVYKLVSKHYKEKYKLRKKITHLTKRCHELEACLKNKTTDKTVVKPQEYILLDSKKPDNGLYATILLIITMVVSYIFIELCTFVNLDNKLISVNLVAIHCMILMTYWLIS
jgi:hypothetical protein